MHKHKVGLAVHYLSMPEHPYYKKELGWKSTNYPNAERVGKETASLIITPDITKKNLDYIIDKIKYVFNTCNK